MIHAKDFGEYSVKNVKSFIGMEGLGFNANLYRGKKKIAFCMDDANGGMVHIDWDTGGNGGAEGQLLRGHVANLPKVISSHDKIELTIDEGWFVIDLVSKWEDDKEERKLQRACKTKTLFRCKADVDMHPDEKFQPYWTINKPFNENTRAKLEKEYGHALAQIINEKYL